MAGIWPLCFMRTACLRLSGREEDREGPLHEAEVPAPGVRGNLGFLRPRGHGATVLVVMAKPGTALTGQLRRLLPQLCTIIGDPPAGGGRF